MGFFRFLWRKKGLIALGLLIGIGLGIYWQNRPAPEPLYETETVGRRSLLQEVSATGTIEPTAKITLRFQTGGTVDSIPVHVGDLVTKGNLLVELDSEEFSLAVASAQAELAAAQADYAKALAGSTDEAIDVAKAAVEKAEADLEQAEKNLTSQERLGDQAIAIAELAYDAAVSDHENLEATYALEVAHVYEDAVITLDSALTQGETTLREIDNLLGVDHEATDASLLSALQANSSSKYTSAVNVYKEVSREVETLAAALQELEADEEDAISEALLATSNLLEEIDDLIEVVDALVEAAPIAQGFDDSKRSEVRAMLATQEESLLDAESNLSAQDQAIESLLNEQESELQQAENAIDRAEQDLAQVQLEKESNVAQAEASVAVYESLLDQAEASLKETQAGPRSVDLAALKAAIDRAETQLEMARHDLSRASLHAPTEGIVTQLYFEEGESLNTADNVIQIVSTDYQITANIPESDIAKIEIGDRVRMTLDAFSYDQLFEGTVHKIDPAETVVEGVIYYQVESHFTLAYEGVKPGMTANMDILTAEDNQALAIPLRALKYERDRIYVQKVDPQTQTLVEVDVVLGIRDDQYVQILSGLVEGNEVVTLMREEDS